MMREFVVGFAIFISGIAIGMSTYQDKLYNRCVKANPTVESGKINSYCEERLYIKEKSE